MNRLESSLKVIFVSSSLFAGGVVFVNQSGLLAHTPGHPSATPSNMPSTLPSGMPSNMPSSSPSDMPIGITTLSSLKADAVLNFLHHLCASEVSTSTEALEHLTNPKARSFAQMMVTTHQEADDKTQQFATQKTLPIYPYQPSTFEMACNAQLNALTGSDFDLAYLQLQLSGHQRALQDLTVIQGLVKDAEIQSLINQQLPIIQSHIDLANTTIRELTTSTAPSTSPSGSPSANPSTNPSDTPSST